MPAPNLQYLKDEFPFESSIFVICSLRFTPANRLKVQEMAVLEGPDFKIFRGSLPPDLPALGPLFTNFLDAPLIETQYYCLCVLYLLDCAVECVSQLKVAFISFKFLLEVNFYLIYCSLCIETRGFSIILDDFYSLISALPGKELCLQMETPFIIIFFFSEIRNYWPII